MKLKSIVFSWAWLLAMPFVVTLASAGAPLSAKRNAGESYHKSIERNDLRPKYNRLFGESDGDDTAYGSRVNRFEDVNVVRVSDIGSLERMQKVFETYRDLRYINDPSVENFLRRLTWMYPDDGCFLRAELFGRLTEIEHNPAISKLFVFGDLDAPTTNHPEGHVQWWYHVAPTYRLNNELYVMDPSIEPKNPITQREWAKRVGDKGIDGQTTLEWSVCAAHAVDPSSNCENPEIEPENTVKGWLSSYLEAERERAIELGRKAEDVLGDHPPWLTPTSSASEVVQP